MTKTCAVFAILIVVIGGCGDDLPAPAQLPVAVSCDQIPGVIADFENPLQFGNFDPGTLRNFNLDGTWFIENQALGQSTVTLQRHDFDGLYEDQRNTQRYVHNDDFVFFEIQDRATRISNRRFDGTVRRQTATCTEGVCTVCSTSLRRASWLDGETESEGLVLTSTFRDESWKVNEIAVRNVRVQGDIAYVASENGLTVVDISDLHNPTFLSRWIDIVANDVKIFQRNGRRFAALVGYSVFGSVIIDVTDSRVPRLMGTIPVAAHTLFHEDRDGKALLYFGGLDGNTEVYDVSEPSAPLRLGTFATGASYVHDLMVNNGIAYLNAWENGLYRVDFRNPASPIETGRWPTTPLGTSHSSWATTVNNRPIVLHGDEERGAYLSVLDADPTSRKYMQEIGHYQTRPLTSIHNIMAVGNKAYIAYYQDGVRVVDLSDPTRPRLAGYFNTWQPDGPSNRGTFAGAIGIDVDPDRHLVFVADNPRGLMIFQDETSP
jgi:hypothetical protein